MYVRIVRLIAALLPIVAIVLVVLPLSAVGCSRKGTPTAEATAEAPVVSDKTEGLLLTWIDEKGEFHAEQRVSEVPESGRDVVRVRVLDPSTDIAASGDRIFVADLRVPKVDGTYPVRSISRAEFEDVAVKRREKSGTAVLAPKAAASAAIGALNAGGVGAAGGGGGAAAGNANAGDVAGRPAVIIYGASWCGPCHQAAAHLKKRGIPFVEHDIEQDSSAAREMQTKLAKAGMRGGSIPVLDVRGRMLIGFDANAVDRALAQ